VFLIEFDEIIGQKLGSMEKKVQLTL